jgi:hypothetical protein
MTRRGCAWAAAGWALLALRVGAADLVRARVPLFYDRAGTRLEAYLAPHQGVTRLQQVDGMCEVEARVATGPATGWIRADAIEMQAPVAPPPGEPSVGMSKADVLRALGNPDRRQKNGASGETWFYSIDEFRPRYRQSVPRPGVSAQVNVGLERVRAGCHVIEFDRDRVTALHEENAEGRSAH